MLLEAIVAAAVVGIALLFLVALLAHESRLRARAAGQEQALAALEAVIEGVRAGALVDPLPPAPTTITWDAPAPPWVPLPPGRGAVLWLLVTPSPTVADVWELQATMRYRAGRDLQTRTLTSRIWRPSAPP